MFNPNDPMVKNSLPKIKKALMDKNIEIYFYPSKELRNMIISGSNPKLQGIAKGVANILISENGMRIAKGMLFNWLDGSLDEKNSFLLSMGEIKVVGSITNVKNVIENKISEE